MNQYILLQVACSWQTQNKLVISLSHLSSTSFVLVKTKHYHFYIKVKVCFYIAQYPVRWTAQSALHFSSTGRPVHSDTNSAYLGSILAMKQLRNDYSLTCPPLSIARYSFIQLSRLRRREENENAQTSKR